jgi:hypothetical protein
MQSPKAIETLDRLMTSVSGQVMTLGFAHTNAYGVARWRGADIALIFTGGSHKHLRVWLC